ncbi:MAG: DUF3135 domain-containing protein [Gammaproteobacteria bacterium]|nr:DUF3135 domain-containing protein [Gammaproteobacteria bacterium]
MLVETSQYSIDVTPGDLESWSFDDWKDLYEKDPDEFHRHRVRMLEYQIELAPDSVKQRLKGLMFQMECESARARTPLLYTMRLSAMMMDMFEELRQQLQSLCLSNADQLTLHKKNTPSAKILAFKKSSRQTP